MHGTTIDRASGGDECLTGDLTAEDTLHLLVRTDATKDVDFDGFQVEQAHDRVEGGLRHPVILPRSGNPPLFFAEWWRCPSSSIDSCNSTGASCCGTAASRSSIFSSGSRCCSSSTRSPTGPDGSRT